MSMSWKLAGALLPCGIVLNAGATDTTYTNKSQWQAAVNNVFEKITFTDYPPGTIITSQYNNVGLTFTEPDNRIYHLHGIFLNDEFGLSANVWNPLGLISVNFAVPQLFRYDGPSNIDDLYFNAAPAPGALALLGIAALISRPRRRVH